MKQQTLNPTTVASDGVEFVHYSDGSELIPSEISSEPQRDGNAKILVSGYTMDDEGIINNYALEPEITATTYPSPKQQLRYALWGFGAIVFVTSILLIAFAVS